MKTDLPDDIQRQQEWLSDSLRKDDYYHWIVQSGGRDIGLISINDYRPESRSTSWGFYIGEDDAVGAGALVPKFFYNFVFSELSVDTIRAHIFYTNINVIKMHLLQGYQFEPSNDYVIEKSGRTILLVAMCYSAEDFFRSKQIPKAVDFPMKNWKRSR